MKVREHREKLKYKQEYIANMLNIKQNTYSQKENGIRNFTLEEALELAEFYGVSVEELFK